MLYCSKCMKLTDELRCPVCRNRRLAEPKTNDPVFLIDKSSIWAGMISDVLETNGIPFVKKIAFGDGITDAILGYGSEIFSFYVPYSALEAARDLIDPLFTPVDDDEFEEGEEFESDDQTE